MPEKLSLKEAVEERGVYAVWELLEEDEQRQAAVATWENAEKETRLALQMTLAKDLKFRPQSVRRLPAEKVAGRLVLEAKTFPESVLFQFLFHFHMQQRRPLLSEFLDEVGLPHNDGVLDLPEDADGPEAAKVAEAGRQLVDQHDHQALVYLATLKVADGEFWKGVDDVLEQFDEDGNETKEKK